MTQGLTLSRARKKEIKQCNNDGSRAQCEKTEGFFWHGPCKRDKRLAWNLRALWLTYANLEQEHQERVQRQIMAQEVLQALPRDVVMNELVPFLPYKRSLTVR